MDTMHGNVEKILVDPMMRWLVPITLSSPEQCSFDLRNGILLVETNMELQEQKQ